MTNIQLLPDPLISQIAAGEVVERPASVVKELLENALDADAESIHVTVRGGGRGLIRISDNGSGIPAEEVALAFARHATSKLRTVDDLERILTLGFRGEALSSIAAVSRVTMTTRHRDESVGASIRIEGGQVLDEKSVGAPAGTVISIENLFFNTPARLKFLKNESTEKRHIAQLVTRYAMAYPQVRFTLEQDGREMLHTTGSGELADVLVKVLGLEYFKQMVPVDVTDAGGLAQVALRVTGYTSLPSLHRADRGQISVFVNGRWVNDSKLSYAVVQAYHGMLADNRHPVAVLMVDIPPQEVDVNVHPTKAEVRFRDSNAVFTTVQRGVRTAVVSAGGRLTSSRLDIDSRHPMGWGGERQYANPQQERDFGAETEPALARPAVNPREYAEDDIAIPSGAGRPLRPRTLPLLRVVGQVGATYVIAEGPAGLYLIDQHAAHHRVLFEELQEAVERGTVESAALMNPQTVEVLSAQVAAVERGLDLFAALGFDMALFGTNAFQVRAVPSMLAHTDVREVVLALLDDLSAKITLEDLARRVSGFGAVKIGQVLNAEEMQAIVRRLERAVEPLTDPLGRPTLIHMSGDQLAREFGK